MIYLGADHGGFELKSKIKVWLEEWGFEFEDLGAHELNSEDDYTDFVEKVATRVDSESDSSEDWREQAKGILLCRSGGGMLIGANRFAKVRGVYVFDEESAIHSRRDNDANVISLAGDWVEDGVARVAVKAWLETEFSGEERHVRRLKKIDELGRV